MTRRPARRAPRGRTFPPSRSRSKVGSRVVLALSLLATLVGVVIYGDAFLRHDSPVFVLLFLSIPFVQWGIGLVAVVAAVISRIRRPAATG